MVSIGGEGFLKTGCRGKGVSRESVVKAFGRGLLKPPFGMLKFGRGGGVTIELDAFIVRFVPVIGVGCCGR